jgi:hypothetical protein
VTWEQPLLPAAAQRPSRPRQNACSPTYGSHEMRRQGTSSDALRGRFAPFGVVLMMATKHPEVSGGRHAPETDGGHTDGWPTRLVTVSKPKRIHAPRTMTLTPSTRRARPRWWPGVAAWALWTLTMLGIPVIAWLDQLLRQAWPAGAGPAHPRRVRWPGAGVCERDYGQGGAGQPPARHPVGWLLLVLRLSLAWGGVAPAYAAYGLLARPGRPPAAHAVVRSWPVTVITAQTALGFVLLLTPPGRCPRPAGAGGPGRPWPPQPSCWWGWR